jgi:hypothetical protein
MIDGLAQIGIIIEQRVNHLWRARSVDCAADQSIAFKLLEDPC